MDLEFYVKVYVKNASERKSAIQASYPVRRQVLFGIMSRYDPKFGLKINIGHCDLYFMV